MRGGSAAALVGASDGKFYVVKTQRRDLPPRLLANEYIATLLAARVGLPVAEMAGVELNLPFLRASYDAMCAHRQDDRWFVPGLAFGSLAPPPPFSDWSGESEALAAVNASAFAGVLLFDIWTANVDTRQAVFARRAGATYAYMIDHGHCFNAGRWQEMARAPVMPLFRLAKIYQSVTGWASFEPYLSRIERLTPRSIWGAVKGVPSDWLREGRGALSSLVFGLAARAARLRDVLTLVLVQRPDLFPRWFSSPGPDLVRLPPRVVDKWRPQPQAVGLLPRTLPQFRPQSVAEPPGAAPFV